MGTLAPLWIMVAGSAGAVARFVVDGIIRARFGRRFPFGTVAINISGSLLLGVLTGLVLFRHQSMLWTSIAGTGFCGGFTTFSSFSLQTLELLQAGEIVPAFLYMAGSVLFCVLFVWLGWYLGRL